MADIFNEEQRSYVMSRIKSKDTKPELIVRKFLYANGFRYRLHDKRLPGSPDLVLKKYRSVIFVNGCFWHGHKACKAGTRLPKTRAEWWKNKLEKNRKRDLKKITDLLNLNWHVITVWGCQLKSKVREKTLIQLAENLRKNKG
ncbi:MAG: very short patch repair endonuclease [Saprospiraceae bacterium]